MRLVSGNVSKLTWRQLGVLAVATVAAVAAPSLSAHATEIKDNTTGLHLFDVGTAGENTSASVLAVSNGGSATANWS